MPKRPSQVAADQIRALRKRHGWTQEELADRVKALGSPIERVTIAKIELGDRVLSLDEAFLFALALDVAPIFLFLPLEPDEQAMLAPSVVVSPEDARAWVAGRHPLGEQDPRFYFTEVPKKDFLERLEIHGWVEDESHETRSGEESK